MSIAVPTNDRRARPQRWEIVQGTSRFLTPTRETGPMICAS